MNEYDRRQLLLIKAKVDLFKKNKIVFSDLMYDVEGLINAAEEIENAWKELFISYWNNLEVIYAYSLYTNSSISLEDEKEITKIIDIANNLIDEKLFQEDAKVLQELEISNSKITLKANKLDGNWLMCPVCIDAWQTDSTTAMAQCPKCKSIMHNPNYQNLC